MPVLLVSLDEILVTIKFSVSPPESFVNTPSASFFSSKTFSFTEAVSAEPTGPLPVTVIVRVAVAVAPSLSVTV